MSGLAFGIDAAAHRGALAAGGATVAVLASGVDVAYPRAHLALYDRAACARRPALVVSEHPLGAAPQRARFLVRNRLIAALSAGTVVVEAAPTQRRAFDGASRRRAVPPRDGGAGTGHLDPVGGVSPTHAGPTRHRPGHQDRRGHRTGRTARRVRRAGERPVRRRDLLGPVVEPGARGGTRHPHRRRTARRIATTAGTARRCRRAPRSRRSRPQGLVERTGTGWGDDVARVATSGSQRVAGRGCEELPLGWW